MAAHICYPQECCIRFSSLQLSVGQAPMITTIFSSIITIIASTCLNYHPLPSIPWSPVALITISLYSSDLAFPPANRRKALSLFMMLVILSQEILFHVILQNTIISWVFWFYIIYPFQHAHFTKSFNLLTYLLWQFQCFYNI